MFLTIVNGIQPVTSNFFNSIGKSQLGVFMSLTRQIIFLLPLIIIFPIFMGIDGVMYAGPIADAAAAIVCGYFTIRELKELKKLEGEREFYNSIFLEEDSFYIHIDEQYYISQIEKLIEISGVTGEYVKPMELYAILSVKYTEIEQDEYERIILLFEKFRFMGYTKNKLVI